MEILAMKFALGIALNCTALGAQGGLLVGGWRRVWVLQQRRRESLSRRWGWMSNEDTSLGILQWSAPSPSSLMTVYVEAEPNWPLKFIHDGRSSRPMSIRLLLLLLGHCVDDDGWTRETGPSLNLQCDIVMWMSIANYVLHFSHAIA